MLIFISTLSFSQEELKSKDILDFVTTFKIIDGQIIGQGADTIKKRISESQFFLLGEQHYSPEISELTNCILPILASKDFDNFVIEIGPNSASKLVNVIKNQNSLLNFNSDFYEKYNDIPIPFFDGKKDEVFLKTAISNGFKLWGIDQEYLSSHMFLIEELYNQSENRESLKQYFDDLNAFIISDFAKGNNDDSYPMFTNLLNSKEVKQFFAKASTKSEKLITSELIKSWEIYALNETKRYSESNTTRMENMKRNFGVHYRNVQKNISLPKVFVKLGSMHLANGKNWLGIYDLGNMINELAYFNDTKSTSINCFARYSMDVSGNIYDYLEEDGGEDYRLILELAKKDEWILIETKPILKLANIKKVKLNDNLKILISGFDYILFSPTRTQTELNYVGKN
tara:strand:- start:5 stop:1201 length:1197 start_codon:yes stop_codon:yes gene_type:complete